MRRLLVGLLVTLSFVGLAVAQSSRTTLDDRAPKPPVVQVTAEESEAISRLHAANQKEIGAGALAAERGQTGEVRNFGRHLVDDHTAADRKLKDLAQKKSVKLSDSESSVLSTLRATPDSEFDRVFVATMIKEHDAAIELVREAQEECKDPEIRAFLKTTLPMLLKHRDMAERISDKSKS